MRHSSTYAPSDEKYCSAWRDQLDRTDQTVKVRAHSQRHKYWHPPGSTQKRHHNTRSDTRIRYAYARALKQTKPKLRGCIQGSVRLCASPNPVVVEPGEDISLLSAAREKEKKGNWLVT